MRNKPKQKSRNHLQLTGCHGIIAIIGMGSFKQLIQMNVHLKSWWRLVSITNGSTSSLTMIIPNSDFQRSPENHKLYYLLWTWRMSHAYRATQSRTHEWYLHCSLVKASRSSWGQIMRLELKRRSLMWDLSVLKLLW